jgi:cytochrome P450
MREGAPARCSTPSRTARPSHFLSQVAAELPMQMVRLLLGVPEEDRHWMFEAVEWTRSNRHTGIRHMMVEMSRRTGA